MCLPVVIVVVVVFNATSLLPAVAPVDHGILPPLDGNTRRRDGDHGGGIPPMSNGVRRHCQRRRQQWPRQQRQRPRPQRRRRFQTENDVTIVPIFQSGSTCKGIKSEERKGRKILFLFIILRQQLLRKTNLDPIFSESRFGTIANKNKKRITAGTQYNMSPQITNNSTVGPKLTIYNMLENW
jgi:hypothetical protein